MSAATATLAEAPPLRPAADRWANPRVNPWVVAIVVTLATFMEILDTSIANVSLPHIAGGLGTDLRPRRRGCSRVTSSPTRSCCR